jgi:hypothetical protein
VCWLFLKLPGSILGFVLSNVLLAASASFFTDIAIYMLIALPKKKLEFTSKYIIAENSNIISNHIL